MSDGPKFSCPECGKQYPWKPELAGKKGKCKCGAIMHVPNSATGVAARSASKKNGSLGGSSVMNGSSHFASRPRPTPKPVATGDSQYAYDGNGEGGEQDVVVAPPAYSPAGATATATAPRAAGTKFAPAPQDETTKRELNWAAAMRSFAPAALIAIWAIYEFMSPLDPSHEGRVMKLRLVVLVINMVLGPMGGGIVLSLFAAAAFAWGVLVLLGKAKDPDYEHEKAQGAWPASRGRR